MLKKKIEDIRTQLNNMMINENTDKDDLLKLSQKLDTLILEDIKEKQKCSNFQTLNNEVTLEEVLEKAKVFKKMYEVLRVVDPLNKRVVEHVINKKIKTDIPCYGFWQRNELCENCISMRSFNHNKVFIKIEHKDESYFMITSIPVEINGTSMVVELFKDITENLYIEDYSNKPIETIGDLVQKLNYSAVRDGLTGAYNRAYINERFPVEMAKSCEKGLPISIIFVDLDHFKYINDTYGHAAGDKVLREVVNEFECCIRKEYDWIARYGGEEFLICLPNTDLNSSRTVAERMRKGIEERKIQYGNTVIQITASFGVHMIFNNDACPCLDSVIEELDRKLYRAKNEGRNRVV